MNITTNQMEKLEKITPEEMFVSEETMNEINEILNLENQTNFSLQIMRDSIVKYFSSITNKYYNKDFTKVIKPRDDEYMAIQTRVSMITAVIDHVKWNRGMAV